MLIYYDRLQTQLRYGDLRGKEMAIQPCLLTYGQISATSNFANDLGLDSLDTVEVVMAIEEEFSIEIPDKDADSMHSIDQAVDYICAQPDAH